MDRLTQLQDTLDDVSPTFATARLRALNTDNTQLLTQMYASLNYIQQKHPYGDLPGQPSQAEPPAPAPKSAEAHTNGDGATASDAAGANGTAKVKEEPKDDKKEEDKKADGAPTHIPDQPEVFESTMREMARSLILQEQKAEILINSMPGIGNSEGSQKARMAVLMEELKQMEGERAKAEVERERMIDTLGDVIVGIQRVR
jgi:mediator of RNA polymerase II transcription subunit 21